VDLSAVAVVEDHAERLILVAATQDRRLWRMALRAATPVRVESWDTIVLPDRVRRLRPAGAGSAVACGDTGLYLLDESLAPRRLAAGGWQDAVVIPGAERSIAAVTTRGDVVRLNPSS
jgi:hypothetical protein